MSYVNQLQTLSREDATKVIHQKLSSLALDALSKPLVAEGKKVNGAYSEHNPKIDLYVDGKYHASTNWADSAASAIAKLEEKNPHMKGRITASVAKKKGTNESVINEEAYLDEEQIDEEKFVNVATSQKAIKDAAKALADSPNMWPGPKAGFKRVITTHKKFLAANTKESELIDESIKKVGEYEAGKHKATIHKDSDLQEYKVKFHKDGKHHEPADYFTDDLEDAKGTAKTQVDKSHAADTKKE